MNMKRKLTAVCMTVVLLVITAVPAYAALPDDEIGLMAEYYMSARASLSISSSGIAEATGRITGKAGTTTKTTVHLYLQRYEDGEWVDVDDWILSQNTVSTTLTETKSVDRGYKYRAKASCYAYSGSDYERVIKYSSEMTY
ncbi:MAG: hypothetical protein IKU09_10825 [Firmicutes bacterium]|nr:hypothetical protein [Bacillota bacterium]